MLKWYILICLLLTYEIAEANVRHVPGSYATIQSAINASTNSDTVLVDPGTYFENIHFRGKNIVVTSTFYVANNLSLIDSTIINGSTPSFADTGSCVLITSGEDTTAVLQGFTLTGGTGTLWPDEHSAGSYIEGGGILIALSSPTIRHNIIRNNNVNRIGGTSTGGGGIRLGDGSPRIYNNVIMNNSGQYGGGIVANYARPIIRNNIVSKNTVSSIVGGATYGGGGIWVNHDTAVVENNTITENSSSGGGSVVAGQGGAVNDVFGGKINGRNNIIWGNTQVTGGQIGGPASLTYSDVDGGFSGTGNINNTPVFSDSSYYLRNASPCIDAGDPNSNYNDNEDTFTPGQAKHPSKGGLRNDMGTYGGPLGAQLFFSLESPFFTKITSGQLVTDGGASRSVNWIDYNNDGIPDLFVSNGLSTGQDNLLYRGDGPPNYTFTKITGSPITSDHERSDGSSWADIDNNGTLDAFVVNWYGDNNMLYWNNGDGTFTQSFTGSIVNDGGYSETSCWGDYDNDGYVDLYVANSAGSLVNFLYHNNHDSTFTKITTGEIVTDAFHSRGVTWVDYDNDGDEDMFVANENGENNCLYKNLLKETSVATFQKITTGDIVNDGGNSWSASWGDYDNDGFQDLFVTNWSGQKNFLYRNNGDGTFTKVTSGIIVNDSDWFATAAWGDVDNDGDLDLIVTTAYGSGAHKNRLYRNLLMETGSPTFEKIISGPLVNDLGWSYGVSFGDYDNDGDLDVFVAKTFNEGENNALYRNDNENGNHWVEVKCTGTSSNRSAIGTKVRLVAEINGHPVRQMREISGQSGYCGQNLTAHFGLGNAATIDSLILEWPAGSREVFRNIAANQILSVTEQDTNPPVPVNPADGSSNQHPVIDFRWRHTSGNPLFRLQVSRDSLFSSIDFQDTTITDTSKQIPLSDYTSTYFWRVAVKKLNRVSSWSATRKFNIATETHEYAVDTRWNIVSVPILPLDSLKTALFPASISQAFTYQNGGSYQEEDTLENGVGYWLKFPSAQIVSFTGYPRFDDTIDVQKGWNLIGTLTYPFSVDGITSIPSGIVISDFFGFNAGYHIVDSLKPVRGYWVKVSQAGKVVLSTAIKNPPKNSVKRSSGNENTVRFEDSHGQVQSLYFVRLLKGETINGNYEMPPSPPPGIFDVRYASGRYMEFIQQSATGEFAISISSSPEPISISWKITDTTLVAWLLVDDKKLLMRSNGITMISGTGTQVRLLLSDEELPVQFSLSNNFPNPFNPSTEIEYSLPTESYVRLSVFNILGEQVALLVNQTQQQDTYTVEWNASDYPSGVYVYRLEAIATNNPEHIFRAQRKMVLLR